MPTLAQNQKAFHTYSIEDTFEAGLVLTGHEVKSIKSGQASLAGAFVSIRSGEAYLKNAYIGKYRQASNLESYNESQDRKLLLHKNEILKLATRLNEKGLALVPLELYTKKNRIKLKLGLAKGKKQFDKREAIKRKETKRKIERTIRSRI
ncbi:MAG: SsrA-binding protein [Candidatus Doudnabacteria bacterium RIFCSPLOWO2_02_FULL_48_8]|uniref:SsrA-binding protein n=1 Tax=Candidatus Doudnabacteria bacterium RIFCSPHIGHO2_01_FULL_46_24 TaxID=1817825 RepID=A0A1F5NTA0_9BACT|nr:MAG: SsrA-binding protein [Candidatus Doudnabacteria bacterium RIFCSPHIGHO2_01_FULL_46_24]OGE95322.1 MAG: SsrA-binding protein [Candidatus Doudnabacteria bacterium RIFCSPLOWO2_02_FULL_48_8]OGE95338.1 MAG: SsrA-binding protein [Candidatus Doudnabacteria bacterium RIFCSPHIGHO2_12_FULL_48_11]